MGSILGTTVFITTLTLLVLILGFFFVMFAVVQRKYKGKLLVFFVEKDKTLSMKVFKPRSRTFKTADGKEEYIIDTNRIMLVDFPFNMPTFLQRTLPCLLYPRGNPEPLDPTQVTILPSGLTAAEIANCTDEGIISGIVKATQESELKSKIPLWLFSAISAALALICLVLIWSLSAKVDHLAGLLGG
jgi:hypothetical protein